MYLYSNYTSVVLSNSNQFVKTPFTWNPYISNYIFKKGNNENMLKIYDPLHLFKQWFCFFFFFWKDHFLFRLLLLETTDNRSLVYVYFCMLWCPITLSFNCKKYTILKTLKGILSWLHLKYDKIVYGSILLKMFFLRYHIPQRKNMVEILLTSYLLNWP